MFGETLAYRYELAERLGFTDLRVFRPDPRLLRLKDEKGLRWSYDPDGCCDLRKVEPLRRALAPLRAWVTGQRKDQSPSTRTDIPVVQLDRTFGTPERPLLKFNPLSHWTSRQVWDYIEIYDVPFNALHARGFISIGCEPCTRATTPNQPATT